MAKRKEIHVPKLGDLADVEILEVFVSPGDKVKKEDPLLSLETDKAVMEVPAPHNGEIESLIVAVGDRISEGDLIGYYIPLEEPGILDNNLKAGTEPKTSLEDSRTENQPRESEKTPIPSSIKKGVLPQTPPIQMREGKFHASPSVRKFARELGADLNGVQGTGPKGRIRKEDVQQYIKGVLMNPHSLGEKLAPPAYPEVNLQDFQKLGTVTIQSLNRIKRISGQRLQASWQTIPQVTHADEADITDLEEFRKEQNHIHPHGQKLTLLAFIIKAVIKALQEYPQFNASLSNDGTELYEKKYYNIGFAADTPNGLLVPVIHQAESMGVVDIARSLQELSQRAREGELPKENLSGGSFTVSSLGGIGGTHFTPIINPPEAAILGVSRSQWRPRWNGSEFQARLILPFCLSYDHRIIDGAQAARFSAFLAEVLTDFRISVL